MNKEIEQRLSAYLDGELDQHELDQLLEDVSHTPEYTNVLRRYQLMKQAAKGEVDRYSHIDVSATVAETIAHEAASTTPTRTEVAASGSWLAGLFDVSAWFRPAAGFAVAATVAMVTVLMVNNKTTDQPGQLPAIATQTQKIIEPIKIELASVPQIDQQNEPDIQSNQQLNNYLVNHSRSAAGSSYQGMVPYVRAVAFDPNYRK